MPQNQPKLPNDQSVLRHIFKVNAKFPRERERENTYWIPCCCAVVLPLRPLVDGYNEQSLSSHSTQCLLGQSEAAESSTTVDRDYHHIWICYDLAN